MHTISTDDIKDLLETLDTLSTPERRRCGVMADIAMKRAHDMISVLSQKAAVHSEETGDEDDVFNGNFGIPVMISENLDIGYFFGSKSVAVDEYQDEEQMHIVSPDVEIVRLQMNIVDLELKLEDMRDKTRNQELEIARYRALLMQHGLSMEG